MPLQKAKGKSKKAKQATVSRNISEMHKGKTYARTKRKFGAATANKQAIAASMHAAGMPMRSPMKMRGESDMERYASRRKK